jgi:transcriptional regulator with XRE-family HTH domain
MPEAPGVATTRRRLRTELRRMRQDRKLQQADVARQLDWSPSKLIRIENGSVGISVTDLRALAHLYQAPHHVVEDLVAQARIAKERRWWSAYSKYLNAQLQEFIAYEADASRILMFQSTIVPGLLQTEEYTRTVLPEVSLDEMPAEKLEALVEVRLKRQAILDGEHPPELVIIVDEAALRRLVGGAKIMRNQIHHLLDLIDRLPNLTFGVVPFSAGAHVGMQGPFQIIEFSDEADDGVLFLENALGEMIDRKQEQREEFRRRLERMRERSVSAGPPEVALWRILDELN